jgi:alanine-synthesizing transaminase
MRQHLLSEGANELSYEIREIVKKAEQIKNLGKEIQWENIGDPIQKNHVIPAWLTFRCRMIPTVIAPLKVF